MRYRILISDDEVDIVEMLTGFFRSKGYEVFSAYNGVETLKLAELQPDIILLDINMPKLDGIEVCKKIRDYVSCPILFLTARIEENDKVQGFSVGGDDYIVKPFSLVELEARVQAHLRREERHGMNAKYIYQNALQSSVFSHFADIDGSWNGLSVADVFGDKEIKVGYVNGWLSTSQNMAKIFIVLSLVIILLIAPVFSGEYGGVDNIILTSKYGKTKCATAKVLASLLSAVFITTLVVIFNLLIAVAIYGTEGLDCSILFAPIDFLEGYIPFNITCGTVLKYQILLAFMSAISVTGIVLILSAVCKSQMIAFVISAAIHVIPIMLPISETSALYRIIVLMPLFYSQYISIMSVEQMHNGMLYAVWSIPVAIALVVIGSIISHKAFSKHQVR